MMPKEIANLIELKQYCVYYNNHDRNQLLFKELEQHYKKQKQV